MIRPGQVTRYVRSAYNKVVEAKNSSEFITLVGVGFTQITHRSDTRLLIIPTRILLLTHQLFHAININYSVTAHL